VAAVPTSAVSTKPNKKGNSFLTLAFLILLALIVVVSYLLVTGPDRVQFDFTLSLIYTFETLTALFLVATIIPILFIGFKKYVLPKLRHPGAKQHKFLSTLSRKFIRRK